MSNKQIKAIYRQKKLHYILTYKLNIGTWLFALFFLIVLIEHCIATNEVSKSIIIDSSPVARRVDGLDVTFYQIIQLLVGGFVLLVGLTYIVCSAIRENKPEALTNMTDLIHRQDREICRFYFNQDILTSQSFNHILRSYLIFRTNDLLLSDERDFFFFIIKQYANTEKALESLFTNAPETNRTERIPLFVWVFMVGYFLSLTVLSPSILFGNIFFMIYFVFCYYIFLGLKPFFMA